MPASFPDDTAVLLVGNCGPDTFALESLLKEIGVGKTAVAESADEVETALARQAYKLILLNRVFDATGELALEILAKLSPQQRQNCMLISNYSDAHETAVQMGALSGFGKRQLREPQTRTLIEAALMRLA